MNSENSQRAPTHAVAAHARRLFEEMDFAFLFDPTRKLLSIGFSVSNGTLDPSCYDLLASECRLASFLAIAKGDVAPDHWFRLGRALTPIGRPLTNRAGKAPMVASGRLKAASSKRLNG